MLNKIDQLIQKWFEIAQPKKCYATALEIVTAEVDELEESNSPLNFLNELCDVYFSTFQMDYSNGLYNFEGEEIRNEVLQGIELNFGESMIEPALEAIVQSNYSKLANHPMDDGNYKQVGKYWIKFNPTTGKILKPQHTYVDFKTCLKNIVSQK